MDLTERQRQLLKAIIELYVKGGEPISSELVERAHDLGVSPATIRAEMVRLTDLGYLKQPHTSAGRVPTSMGYRLYIAELMSEKELPIVDEVTIKQLMMDQRLQFDRMLEEATKSLAKKCNALAVSFHDEDIFYAGAANILDFPEFDEIDVVRFVLSLFDQPSLLKQIIGKAQGADKLHVIFGEETGFEYLYPTSFAFLDYDLDSGQSGVIGVVGPNRLNFPLVIPYLRYVGSILSEASKI